MRKAQSSASFRLNNSSSQASSQRKDPNVDDKYKTEIAKYRKTVSFGQNDFQALKNLRKSTIMTSSNNGPRKSVVTTTKTITQSPSPETN